MEKMMPSPREIPLSDFDYLLPPERIAWHPLAERNQSKLLVYKNHEIIDDTFARLFDHLGTDCLLVFNNSKVIHARLPVVNRAGAALEIFCLEPLAPVTEWAEAFQQTGRVTWKCLIGHARKWKEDIRFTVALDGKEIEITARKGECQDGSFEVTFLWDDPGVTFVDWLEHYGKIPLPPYIKRALEAEDDQRYQTVYARHEGSVAAPTAGLHFTESEMAALRERGFPHAYVTLHVGAGTFKPVTSETAGGHAMHGEQIAVEASLINTLLEHRDKKVVAVGTTATRTLESLFIMGAKSRLRRDNPFQVGQWEYYDQEAIRNMPAEEALTALLEVLHRENRSQITGSTRLMITPSYPLKITRGLITNFHQPKSTLLLLIGSILGEKWREIYAHALEHDYRFLSYGDANLYFV